MSFDKLSRLKKLSHWIWHIEILLFVIWVIVELIVFFKIGLRSGGDGPRFYFGAEDILNGHLPSGSGRYYLGYILFISLFFYLNLNLTAVVLGQIFLTGVAAFCLYRISKNLYGIRSAQITTLLYITYPSIHLWDIYIFTESFFTSCLVVSCYLVLKVNRWWNLLIILPILLVTIIARPNGIIFFAALGFYILLICWQKKKILILSVLIFLSVCAGLAAIPLIGNMLSYYSLIEYYSSGSIIAEYDSMLEMPGEIPEVILQNPNPLIQIWLFALDKPAFFMELFFMKLLFFFGHARPYYSLSHNIFTISAMIVIYTSFILGCYRSLHDNREYKLFLISIIAFQAISVGFTHVLWNGRNLVPMLPIIFIFSGMGLVKISKYLNWIKFQLKNKAN